MLLRSIRPLRSRRLRESFNDFNTPNCSRLANSFAQDLVEKIADLATDNVYVEDVKQCSNVVDDSKICYTITISLDNTEDEDYVDSEITKDELDSIAYDINEQDRRYRIMNIIESAIEVDGAAVYYTLTVEFDYE